MVHCIDKYFDFRETRSSMADEKKDVVIFNNFKNLPIKVLLLVGKTGTGKSSLCNKISGHPSNSSIFPVSGGAVSCTQSTVLGSAHFNGERDKLVGLIDTIGFDDPNNDTDVRIIADLVDKLKNGCNYVNLFGITVNGQSPRLDGSLLAMIRIFEEMFGEQFWKQCVLVFTHMPMDKKSKRLRKKNRAMSDDEIASEYVGEVAKKFPKSKGLRYLFLDACYDEEDEDEGVEFQRSMQALYQMLSNAPKLNTSEVNENVKSEHGKLKRVIEEKEKQRQEELMRHAEEAKILVENAEMKRQKDLKKLAEQNRKMQEESLKRHEENLKRQREEAEQRRQEDMRRQEEERRIQQEESERRYKAELRRQQEEFERKLQEERWEFEEREEQRRQKEEERRRESRRQEEKEQERRRHEEEKRREEAKKQNRKQLEENFGRNVGNRKMIGLINNTRGSIEFTSMMFRSQVILSQYFQCIVIDNSCTFTGCESIGHGDG